MLEGRKIKQKKVNNKNNIGERELQQYFSGKLAYFDRDDLGVPIQATMAAEECMKITEGVSEDVPLDENIFDPLNSVIPRSNFTYKHLYEMGEVKLKHKYEKDEDA